MKDKMLAMTEHIHCQDVLGFTRTAIENLNPNFFLLPASSTGNNHPSINLGEGGLARHSIATVIVALDLFRMSDYNFERPYKDMIISALLLHDGFKYCEKSQYVVDHAGQCAKWVVESQIFSSYNTLSRQIIGGYIRTHMGEWGGEVPPPKCEIAKFVHLCDYLASRKNFTTDV
jgi:hypothetical protein